MSERKEQAIYDAVDEAVTRLRIDIYKVPQPITIDKLDTMIAQSGHAAGMAAIAAYRAPLKPKREQP